MKLAEVFPSNFLKSDDLQGRDVPVVIASAEIEAVGQERKLVLTFQGKKKSMICNKTNAGRIAYLYGDDTDGWIGREVMLTSEFVEYQGRTVKGLRIKPPPQRAASQRQTTATPIGNGKQHVVEDRTSFAMSSIQPEPPPHDDLPSDEIPF